MRLNSKGEIARDYRGYATACWLDDDRALFQRPQTSDPDGPWEVVARTVATQQDLVLRDTGANDLAGANGQWMRGFGGRVDGSKNWTPNDGFVGDMDGHVSLVTDPMRTQVSVHVDGQVRHTFVTAAPFGLYRLKGSLVAYTRESNATLQCVDVLTQQAVPVATLGARQYSPLVIDHPTRGRWAIYQAEDATGRSVGLVCHKADDATQGYVVFAPDDPLDPSIYDPDVIVSGDGLVVGWAGDKEQRRARTVTIPDLGANMVPLSMPAPPPIPVDTFGPKGPSRPVGTTITNLERYFIAAPETMPRTGQHTIHWHSTPEGRHFFLKFYDPLPVTARTAFPSKEHYEEFRVGEQFLHQVCDRSGGTTGSPMYRMTDTRWFPRTMQVGLNYAWESGPHEIVFLGTTCQELNRVPLNRSMAILEAWDHFDAGPDFPDIPAIKILYDPTGGIHGDGRHIEIGIQGRDVGPLAWESHRTVRDPRTGAPGCYDTGTLVLSEATMAARSVFYRKDARLTPWTPDLSPCALQMSSESVTAPLAITITDYTKVGVAPALITAEYRVSGGNLADAAGAELLIDDRVVASSTGRNGTLSAVVSSAGTYALSARVTTPTGQARTGAIRHITISPPLEVPPMPLPTDVLALVRRFAAAFPIPRGDGSDAWIDAALRKGWTRRMCEQVAFTFGPKWGSKRQTDNHPDSKEALALNDHGLHVWDMLIGAATGAPTLATDPAYHFVPTQVFVPVTPVDHLGSIRPPVSRPTIQTPLWGITSFDLGVRLTEGDRRWLTQVLVPHRLVARVVCASTSRTRRTLTEGVAQTRMVAQALQAVGLKAQYVLLCDTRVYGLSQQGALQQVRELNAVLAAYPATVAGIQIGNENSHGVEQDYMSDPAFLAAADALIDPRFPVAWGAGHGGEGVSMAGGSYLVHHSDRSASPAANALVMALAQTIAKRPVVDDEPLGVAETDRVAGRQRTDDVNFGATLARAAKARALGGVTFHLDAGMSCNVDELGPRQRAALDNFVREIGGTIPVPALDPILDAPLSPAYPTGYAFFIANGDAIVKAATAWYTRATGRVPASSDVWHGVWRGLNEGERWGTLRQAWENTWPGGGPTA